MIDIGKFTTIKEQYTLPSLGKIYGVAFNPTVTIRSMTTQEEMILTGYAENEYKKICDVIESCIEEKLPVHVYDMCIGDYVFLLHKFRIVSYGSKYPLNMQCPNCGGVVKSEIDLDELETVEFNAEKIGDREITLPQTKLKVKLSFQTPRILDEIKSKSKEYKTKRKTQGVNYDLLFEVMSYIAKVDNEVLDEAQLEQLVLQLPVKDVKYIKQKGIELNGKVGLDTSIIAKCPDCGYEVLTRFQFQSEFFNPEISED